TLADHIEQITVLARGRVGPLAGGSLAAFRAEQPDIHGASWCIARVADDPIAPDAPTVGEVLTTHRLGLARETVCQIAGGCAHDHLYVGFTSANTRRSPAPRGDSRASAGRSGAGCRVWSDRGVRQASASWRPREPQPASSREP